MACVVVAVAVSVVAFVVVRDLYGACFVSFSFLFFQHNGRGFSSDSGAHIVSRSCVSYLAAMRPGYCCCTAGCCRLLHVALVLF